VRRCQQYVVKLRTSQSRASGSLCATLCRQHVLRCAHALADLLGMLARCDCCHNMTGRICYRWRCRCPPMQRFLRPPYQTAHTGSRLDASCKHPYCLAHWNRRAVFVHASVAWSLAHHAETSGRQCQLWAVLADTTGLDGEPAMTWTCSDSTGNVLCCVVLSWSVYAACSYVAPCFRLILAVWIRGASEVRTACPCTSSTTVR